MAKQELTQKEIKLIKGLLEGKTKQQAALDAYDTTDPMTASAIASETLKKPKVQEAYQAELSRQGITMEKVIAPVAKALQAKVKIVTQNGVVTTEEDDLEMQLKGHDRVIKMLNMDKGGESPASIHFHQHIEEKKAEYDF